MKDYVYDPMTRIAEPPRPSAGLPRLLGRLFRLDQRRRRILGFAARAQTRLRAARSDLAALGAELDDLRETHAELASHSAELERRCRSLRNQNTELSESLARGETRMVALLRRLGETAPDAAAEKRRRAERDAWGEVSLDNLATFIDTYYPEALLLTRRAESGLRKSLYGNPALVRRCLEILATDYRRHRLNGESEPAPRYLAKLAKLGVTEAGIGTQTTATHRGAYTAQVEGRGYLLDRHLKKGVGEDETTVFRLYFCWDAETSRVIVGHLTTHLPTVKGGRTMA